MSFKDTIDTKIQILKTNCSFYNSRDQGMCKCSSNEIAILFERDVSIIINTIKNLAFIVKGCYVFGSIQIPCQKYALSFEVIRESW